MNKRAENIERFQYIRENGVIKACKDGVIKKPKVSISGGKDSLATLLWTVENLAEYAEPTAIFVKTALEFSDLDQYITDICNILKVKLLIREHGENTDRKLGEFFHAAENFGLPNRVRYCEATLKAPLYLLPDDDFDINIIGNRWGESNPRANTCFLYREGYQFFYNPVLSLSSYEVFEKIKDAKLPVYNSYKYLNRLSCALCPFNFQKSKLATNIQYCLLYPEKVNWAFFNKWFDIIKEHDVFSYRIGLRKSFSKFLSNYHKMKKLRKEDIQLTERGKFPVYEWY